MTSFKDWLDGDPISISPSALHYAFLALWGIIWSGKDIMTGCYCHITLKHVLPARTFSSTTNTPPASTRPSQQSFENDLKIFPSLIDTWDESCMEISQDPREEGGVGQSTYTQKSLYWERGSYKLSWIPLSMLISSLVGIFLNRDWKQGSTIPSSTLTRPEESVYDLWLPEVKHKRWDSHLMCFTYECRFSKRRKINWNELKKLPRRSRCLWLVGNLKPNFGPNGKELCQWRFQANFLDLKTQKYC